MRTAGADGRIGQHRNPGVFSVLLEGHLIEGERDGFTALLTEKFKLTKTFDGFQKIDLTYNVEDANNWVITELWDSKEVYQK